MHALGDLLQNVGVLVAAALIYFQPGDDVVSDAPERGAVDIPEEFFGDFSLDEDLELIRDERGVRIARESDD